MIRALILVLVAFSASASVADEFRALREKHLAAEVKLASEWLMTADLEDVPLPALPADPRDSDRAARADLEGFNGKLAYLRGIRDTLKDAIPNSVPWREAVDNFATMTKPTSAPFWARYTELKGRGKRQ